MASYQGARYTNCRTFEGEFGTGDQVIVDVSKDGLNFEKILEDIRVVVG